MVAVPVPASSLAKPAGVDTIHSFIKIVNQLRLHPKLHLNSLHLLVLEIIQSLPPLHLETSYLELPLHFRTPSPSPWRMKEELPVLEPSLTLVLASLLCLRSWPLLSS